MNLAKRFEEVEGDGPRSGTKGFSWDFTGEGPNSCTCVDLLFGSNTLSQDFGSIGVVRGLRGDGLATVGSGRTEVEGRGRAGAGKEVVAVFDRLYCLYCAAIRSADQ